MRKKLFLYYLLLIVIGISVTGFFTSQVAQKFYKFEVEEKLKNTAILIKHDIDELPPTQNADYNKMAQDYAKLLNHTNGMTTHHKSSASMRITLIAYNGTVVGESQADYKSMENHLNRKEVKEAISGEFGQDIRFSKTLGVNLLYIAVPVKSANMVVRVAVPLTQVNRINQLIWYYAVAGIVAGLLITALLALRFSSSLTRPIKELISVSKDIARGNYLRKVKIDSKDELGLLANTFNEMAEKLDKTISDMTDKNIKVETIINSMISGIVAVDSKYKIILINSIACEMFNIKNGPGLIGINILELIRNSQINGFLKDTIEKNVSLVNEIIIGAPEEKVLRIHTTPIKTKESLDINGGGIVSIQDITNIKKLEQIRTEFVSNVTHELKTPLTSIRGFIETLRSGAINDAEVAEKFLEIIDIEAERLYILINDILQLSEIESKQKDTNIAIHKLKPIVDETISILQGVADKKGVTLTSDMDENLKVSVNKDRIKQMFINLIDNGIKYNYENGNVHVIARKDSGKIVISVKDTGIGISREHLPRIFERFYRIDKGRSRNMGGTGLGLSIVKHIVNLYNGDIKVRSEPGGGTEFIIQLPA